MAVGPGTDVPNISLRAVKTEADDVPTLQLDIGKTEEQHKALYAPATSEWPQWTRFRSDYFFGFVFTGRGPSLGGTEVSISLGLLLLPFFAMAHLLY